MLLSLSTKRSGSLRPILAAGLLIATAMSLICLPLSTAPALQPSADPYTKVDPVALPLDRSGVWTLHFAYLPPRIIPVQTADGRKMAWYMVYKVWNTSDTPVLFVPEIELVTKDGPLRTFLDEPQPMVVEQIRKKEDPTGELKLKTSVSMSKEKIPVTKPDSVPRAIYGVAVWLEVPEKASTTNHFSVYAAGLSNGLAVSEADGASPTVTRKTLQIDFFRPTDNSRPGQNDIRPNENAGLGAEKWIYRAVPASTKPATPVPAPATPEEKKN